MTFAKQKRGIYTLVLASLCTAFGVVLPLVFHSIPNAGSILLPMHIPVLVCGLICGWPYGLSCGILTPLLSSLLTGMPPMAYLPSMICELAVYGLFSGVIYRYIKTKMPVLDVYIALTASMLAGRVVFGILNALIFRAGAYTMQVWLASAFITAFPGIVIQLLLIPSFVLALQGQKPIAGKY